MIGAATSAEVGRLVVRLLGDSASYKSMLQDAKKQAADTAKAVENFGQRIETTGASLMKFGVKMKLFVTAPLVGAGVLLAKTASDAEETANKFAVTFSGVERQANSMVATLDKAYGLSDMSARKLMSNTGDLLTGFGFTQEAAADLSFEVQKLAVDLASFTNIEGGAERASDALTKGLLGEREMMKSLGIAILENDVKAQMAKDAARGLTYESERQAKAYATLQLAIQQSKNAIGDYGRTSGSLANQTRELWEDIRDLRVEFGKLLIPLGSALVGSARTAVSALANMGTTAKILLLSIGGLVAAIGPTAFAAGSLLWAFGKLAPLLSTVVIPALRATAAAMLGLKAASWEVYAIIAAMIGIWYAYKKAMAAATDEIDAETAVLENQTNIMQKRLNQLQQEIDLTGMRNELLKETRAQREADALESARFNVQRARAAFEEARAGITVPPLEGTPIQEFYRHGVTRNPFVGPEHKGTQFDRDLIAARKKALNDAYTKLIQLETKGPSTEQAQRDAIKAFQIMRAPFEMQQQWRDVMMASINQEREDTWTRWQRDFGAQAWAMKQLPGAWGGNLASLFGATRRGLGASLGAMFWRPEEQAEQARGIQSFVGRREAVAVGSVEASQRRAQTLTQLKQAEKQIQQEAERKRREEKSQQKMDSLTAGLGNLGKTIEKWISTGTTSGVTIDAADFE